jgi:hypothetical protein
MSIAIRIVTAVATAVTGVLVPSEPSPSVRQATPSIELLGMTADEQAAARHQVALFDAAGLSLPPMTISRHDDKAACNGHEGLHRTDGARSVIDVCTITGVWQARTILHELTHAWAFHFLTTERMAAFKSLRGWQHWLDNDTVWEDNGAEQAAEIMVWGLSDHAVPVVRIDQRSCSELEAGYFALTGLEPLHGYTTYCDGRSNTLIS